MTDIARATRDEASEEVGGLPSPYLLFLGDTVEPGYAKTAFGLRDWVGERCVGEFVLPGARVSTGLPALVPAQAAAQGARGLVIGVANAGGIIPPAWVAGLVEALEAGLDIISGMHARLSDIPELKAAAERTGRRLIDVRTPPPGISRPSGSPLTARMMPASTSASVLQGILYVAALHALQDKSPQSTAALVFPATSPPVALGPAVAR